jgi:hypothetical protein
MLLGTRHYVLLLDVGLVLVGDCRNGRLGISLAVQLILQSHVVDKAAVSVQSTAGRPQQRHDQLPRGIVDIMLSVWRSTW